MTKKVKVAAAVGVAAAGEKFTAHKLEQAMTQVVVDAMKAGITDPEKILELKMKKRAAMKAGK